MTAKGAAAAVLARCGAHLISPRALSRDVKAHGHRSLHTRQRPFPAKASRLAAVLAGALALAEGAAAQQQAVCPDPPGNPDAGDRVLCTEDANSNEKIVIRLNGFGITAAERSHHGVWGKHEGNGDIDIRVTGGKIKVGKDAVQGDNGEAFGIAGTHENNTAGHVSIDASGVDIDTKGSNSFGVYGLSRGPDGVRIRVRDSAIDTTGYAANAIYGRAHNAAPIDIGVTGGSFRTEGQYARGVRGTSYGTAGDIVLNIRDTAIVTSGESADGVLGWIWNSGSGGAIDIAVSGRAEVTTHGKGARGVLSRNNGTGGVAIGLSDGASARTKGERAHGVHGWQSNAAATGDVRISLSGRSSVRTEGDDARAVYGDNDGTGGVAIGLAGGASVGTKGDRAYGVYGLKFGSGGSGNIAVSVVDSATVATAGDGAHGIHAGHVSGDGRMTVAVGAGASARATGANASGVQLGRLNATTGAIERAAKIGEDGYRRQSVTVNGTVTGGSGDAAGVYLAGGGKVYIGSNGFAGAGSGGPAVCSEGDAAKLLVSLELDGRPPSEALGGAIVNKKGTAQGATLGPTLLYVNGVLMYDEDGATGASAPNGAYDIVSVAADTATAGQLALGFESGSAQFGPRASVYEALPGFLLRLDGGGAPMPAGPASGKASAGESPLWTRLSGGRGSFEASSGSTVGADFDLDRREAAFGADIPLGGGLTGAVGLRFVSGSADASAPTGGGGIDAEGRGVAGALSWRGAGGYFAAARASATDYDLDISSARRGALARRADAAVLSWGAEAGRRAPLFEDAALTVRAWLDRSEADMDGLTDAAGSRLSLADGERATAGAGFGVEALQALEGGGELALAGFAGAAFALDGETAMTVSGAKLRSEADGARVQLGLGADWRMGGGAALAAGLSADGLDSGDRTLSASLALRMAF